MRSRNRETMKSNIWERLRNGIEGRRKWGPLSFGEGTRKNKFFVETFF